MIVKAIQVCIFLSIIENNNSVVVYQRVPDNDWAVKTYVEDRKCFRTLMNESLRDAEVFVNSLVRFKTVLEGYFEFLKKNYSALGDIAKDILERHVPITLRTNLVEEHLRKKFGFNFTEIRKLAKLLSSVIKVHQDCGTITLRIGYKL